MNNRQGIRDKLVWLLMLVSAVLLFCALTINSRPVNVDTAAHRTGRVLGKKMLRLDAYMQKALSQNAADWMDIGDIPEDMVIYKYVEDTLRSWANQFPVINDDIGNMVLFQRLSNPRSNIISPLSQVDSDPGFYNFGPKWYIAKSIKSDLVTLVAGLEIWDSDDRVSGHANPELRLDGRFSVKPVSESGGTAVLLDGQPVFKIILEKFSGNQLFSNASLIWLALFFYILASVLFLLNRPTLKNYGIASAGLVLSMVALAIWGNSLQNNASLFSPTLYADGKFMNSLGTAIICNTTIFLLVVFTYIVSGTLLGKILEKNRKIRAAVFAAMLALGIAGIAIYTHFLLRSIIMNSSITLELYKLNDITLHTGIVYLTILTLLVSILLLLQMLSPMLRILTGVKTDPMSRSGRTFFSIVAAVYIVLSSSLLGARKEQDTVKIWANRLSMDRDISLEIQLRQMEGSIAADKLIGALSALDNSVNMILNRLSESYMMRLVQDYDISVSLIRDTVRNPAVIAYYNERVYNGTPIAPDSKFVYARNANGHSRYTGVFAYFNDDSGITRMLLDVEPKSNRGDMGYASILGYSAPGQVVMPARYSYAKYVDDKLVTFKGNYAYPTTLSEDLKDLATMDGTRATLNDYLHFINMIADDEIIIISRPREEYFNYFVAAFAILLVLYYILSFLSVSRLRRLQKKESNYYKTRINVVMLGSLVVTLVALAAISVIFVYRRNNANLHSLISDKVNSIQTIVENRLRYVQSAKEMGGPELTAVLEDVGTIMNTDITLYTTDGKAFVSSTPEIFDRMVLGSRMNQDAYKQIIYSNRRYYIHKEKISGRRYFFMYAPVFNSSGNMIAVLGSPYTDENYDFMAEAVMHSISVITIFMILLILARILTMAVVDRMFKPLTEMGRKMNAADIGNLEYIIYERDDEISSLVRAYNLMVHDLYNSTKLLTQTERDKAWATMARQVAHEIKNPLTPIKLQIQRLIRLKQNNNPTWEDKFDDISREVLSQIDILADTANEFSTFAKLYTEEPVEINLGDLLQEEVSLFDSSDDIKVSYIGLEDAVVQGPKPQLTRVFVNLISNAIQSIEEMQADQRESGGDVSRGEVIVSLRNSTREGFYDIVIEDNGPGVKDENRSKLFTPNFTTKSKGTGLGLAICRNIIEKCNGEIFYTRSFTLRGACFTVRYPKNII